MEKVVSVQQYRDLVTGSKRRFSGTDTNCLVLSTSLEPVIGEGRMSYTWYEDGVCFFLDEERFYELYYYWNAEAPLADLRRERPVVLSEYSGRGRRDGYIARMAEKAAAAGFRPWEKNWQIELKLKEHGTQIDEGYAASMARMAGQDIRLAGCDTQAQAEQVRALWREGLPATDVPLEHMQFMSRGDAEVFCAFDRAGEVIGAYWWRDMKRGVCEARHVVTRPDHYRQGIGTALTMYCLRQLRDMDFDTWLGWVADTNTRSMAMHESIGCVTNGNSITQFILEGN